MGSLIKIWKTIPMPDGAKIGRNGAVTWTVKGKKRTGKLSTSPGRVTVQSDRIPEGQYLKIPRT